MTDAQHSANPIALILGDGGVKAGFIAGAMHELLVETDIVRRNLAILSASSASVGNVIYYLAFADKHPGQEMWTSILTDKRFLNFRSVIDLYRNKPLYDLDFMIEEIFKKKHPIDQEKVKRASIPYYLATQTLEDSRIVYFTNCNRNTESNRYELKSVSNEDLYEVIKAASAAPLLYDASVCLGGNLYMDAAAIEPMALDLPDMEEAFKIVILTKIKPTVLTKLRYMLVAGAFILLIYPFRRRKLPLQKYIQYGVKPFKLGKLIREVERLEKEGKALLISPSKKIGGLLNNSAETMQENYEHGQDSVRQKASLLISLLTSRSSS